MQALITHIQSNILIQFDLDHKKLYFNNTNKTFAWKSEGDVNCNIYQMSSRSGCDSGCLCSNPEIDSWPLINETSITVEDQLLDEQGRLVAFNIDAYNDDQIKCSNKILVAKFLVEETG